MPEVDNIGAIDYAQYQQQPQAQYDDYANYNTQPEVYDENYAQMQEASKSRLGATLLTAVIIGGGALLGGYLLGGKGKKAAEAAKKTAEDAKKTAEDALANLKNSEAVKNYDKLKEATEKAMADVENLADKGAGKRFGAERCGNGFKEKVEEFFKPVKENLSAAKEAKAAEEKATQEKIAALVEKVKNDDKAAKEELTKLADEGNQDAKKALSELAPEKTEKTENN